MRQAHIHFGRIDQRRHLRVALLEPRPARRDAGRHAGLPATPGIDLGTITPADVVGPGVPTLRRTGHSAAGEFDELVSALRAGART